MEKMIDALKIIETDSPMPSIEIDIDSTTDGNHRDIIEKALVSYTDDNPKTIASIYDYVSASVNFGQPTNSAFFIVAQSQGLLKYLHANLRAEHSLNIRYGDYIPPSKARLAYHIEDGQAWRRDDEVTFSLLEDLQDEEWMEEIFEDERPSDMPEQSNKRPAARTYKARSDASVGSIKNAIETVFGLPEGSVALCAPDGKHLRADAKIRTLRNRWDDN